MHRLCSAGLVAWMALSTASAQGADPRTFRDFTLVQHLRVVRGKQHHGRVQDLVADVASGRVRAAVVAVDTDLGSSLVVVPFAQLAYEPRTHLLQLAADGEAAWPAFDPASVRCTHQAGDGGPRRALQGTVLVSQLASCTAVFADAGEGSVQGATIELTTGHVAFLDVAVGRARAGDRELHPVPWSAGRLVATDGGAGEPTGPVFALPLQRSAVAQSPSCIEIIVQDPLCRTRAYRCFGVPRPDYDAEG